MRVPTPIELGAIDGVLPLVSEGIGYALWWTPMSPLMVGECVLRPIRPGCRRPIFLAPDRFLRRRTRSSRLPGSSPDDFGEHLALARFARGFPARAGLVVGADVVPCDVAGHRCCSSPRARSLR
ncbi:hypothetical protein BJF90_17310 [Pseudonocardia sp. CNS-004]|nr:hypothetical protein BJF90_17310 [Pseudonocardia sp. CNS-004]